MRLRAIPSSRVVFEHEVTEHEEEGENLWEDSSEADADVDDRADCKECSFATIRSLIIDGNRPELLRIPKGGALVEIGNAEMQTVRDCKIYESRWAARASMNDALSLEELDAINARAEGRHSSFDIANDSQRMELLARERRGFQTMQES